MTKKGWPEGNKDNPHTAGSQDPGLSPSADADPKPINILRDDRSPETDQGEVNPHNEAAAQRPGFVPLDRENDRERLRNPKNDKDRSDALREWGREVRTRGNVMSADWERFQELTGERQPPPSAEDIHAAEQKAKDRAYGTRADAETAEQRSATSRKP